MLIRLTKTFNDGLMASSASIAMTTGSVLVGTADSEFVSRVHSGVNVVSMDDRQVQPAVVCDHRCDISTGRFWQDKGCCCGGDGGEAENR